MIKKGFVEKAINTGKLQTAQVTALSGQVHDGVEIFQNYGFTSFPVSFDNNADEGCECVIAESSSNIKVVVARDDRRFRPVVGVEGDVIVFGMQDKTTIQRVYLHADGSIEVQAGSAKFQLTPDGTMNIVASVNITGSIKCNGKNIGDTHKHSGVQAGSGNTGNPV